MQCPRCGGELFPGMTECPDCGCPVYGSTVRTATIVVTSKEARQGAFKILNIPQQAMPVKVRIRPGIKNGAKLTVNNALFFQPDGETMLMPVKVTVVVKRGPIWPWLLVVLLSLSVIACAWRIGAALVNPTPSGTPAQVQATVPDPTRLVQSPATEPQEAAPPVTVPEQTQTAETQATQPAETQPQSGYDGPILYYDQRPLLHQLDEDLLTNLETIYQAAMDFEPTCKFTRPMTLEEMSYLAVLIHSEFPELMQLDNTLETMCYSDSVTGNVTSYELPLVLTEDEYEVRYETCMAAIGQLVEETQGMNDWEKERYVFDYITDNCTYEKTVKESNTPYGVFGTKLAKCDGISLAMKWTMEEMGITCLCITGDSTIPGEEGHAWNMIRLDGEYYNVDVTMDVRKADEECPTLYCALNVTNEMVRQDFVLSPVFTELLSIPQVTTMEKSYHVQNGSYCTAGSDWKAAIWDCFLDAYESGEGARLQFESQTDFEACLAGINEELKRACQEAQIWDVSWQSFYSETFRVVYLDITK
ncbi:MAG: hypothetical protein J6J18_10780 [Oscillospiraceae bacterium]|nr:hypothetical protein [Oscillospiraceae bacterium]